MFGQESDTFTAEQIQNMVTFAIVFVGLTTVGQSFLNKIDPVRQKEKEEAAAREKAAAKKAERDGVQAVIDTKKSTNKNKKKSKKAGGPAEEETAAKKEAESEDTVEDEKEAGAKKELPLEKSYMSVILGEWQPYIIFAIVFFQFCTTFFFPDTIFHTTTTDAQPWVITSELFLQPAQFAALKNDASALLTGLDLVANEPAYNTGFARGVAFSFTEAGRAQAEAEPLLKMVQPFMAKVAETETTAWTVRALSLTQDTHEADSVRKHQDRFAGCELPREEFVAHQTAILFLAVPEELTGGAIEVWDNRSATVDVTEIVDFAENLLVHLRGDAFYKFAGFQLPADSQEQSALQAVVLEQFRIAPQKLEKCASFLAHTRIAAKPER